MAHHTESAPSVDHQFTIQIDQPPLNEATKDEIEEGTEDEHLIKDERNKCQDQLVLQKKRCRNQMIFHENFKDLDNTCMRSATIFKVNMGLRESNPDAYTPMLISIGPYYRGNTKLSSMEKYKLLYLQRFLRRKEGLDAKSCISALEKKKDEALKCYDNFEDDFDVEFLEMLLLDGCFVVEFIREYYATLEEEEDEEEDNIIDLEWMKKQVCRDMVLLENQLPFFVLTMLHDMTKDRTKVSFLCKVRTALLNTFPKAKFITTPEINKINAERVDHLVHAVHKFCQPSGCDHNSAEENINASTQKECCKIIFCGNTVELTTSKESPEDVNIWDCYHIPSATELFDAGVNFIRVGGVPEKNEDKTALFDIKFEKGLLKIPCFAIEDTMETFMRNLIAYEQHSSLEDVYPYFSNYAHIMTQLIGSHRDVNFLRQKRIILKDIGDDKHVASIFKKLSNGVAVTDFYYKEECGKLIQHCEKPWSQMKASLRHNYFQSPWAGASTLAAITLLVLTVIQTVLAFTGAVNKK